MAEAAPSFRDKYGYLPAALTMLAETVGEDIMLKVASCLGGTRISLGPKSIAKSPLTDLIGPVATQMIFDRARRDGLLRLDIPRMSHALTRRRHDRILFLRASGHKVSDVAQVLGMTERNVYYVLEEDRATPDARQLNFPF
jgi:hypothetical protein